MNNFPLVCSSPSIIKLRLNQRQSRLSVTSFAPRAKTTVPLNPLQELLRGDLRALDPEVVAEEGGVAAVVEVGADTAAEVMAAGGF
jgi:hypothetical protein